MKSAPFEYSRATSLDEACEWLAADDGARVIAGGQTLVPMMAMRLARPTRLIDINRIASLSYVRAEPGRVSVGATTRQCLVERAALIAKDVPLLACAIPAIGHAATRARGTIGGSLAHADPAAELVLVAVTLDAAFSYRMGGKTAEMSAREFFVGPMTTALPGGAVLAAAHFPVWTGKIGSGFHEINARRSDFAFVAAAAQVELADDNTAKRIAIGVGAATDVPMRLDVAEKQLRGGPLDDIGVKAAIMEALSDIEPLEDLHASAAYRRRVAASLAVRAVIDARNQAQGRKPRAH